MKNSLVGSDDWKIIDIAPGSESKLIKHNSDDSDEQFDAVQLKQINLKQQQKQKKSDSVVAKRRQSTFVKQQIKEQKKTKIRYHNMIHKNQRKCIRWSNLSMTTHVSLKILVIFTAFSLMYLTLLQAFTIYFVDISSQFVRNILDEHAIEQQGKVMNSELIYVQTYLSTIFDLIEIQAHYISQELSENDYPIDYKTAFVITSSDVKQKFGRWEFRGEYKEKEEFIESQQILLHKDFNQMTNQQWKQAKILFTAAKYFGNSDQNGHQTYIVLDDGNIIYSSKPIYGNVHLRLKEMQNLMYDKVKKYQKSYVDYQAKDLETNQIDVLTFSSPLTNQGKFYGVIFWEIQKTFISKNVVPVENSFDDLKLPFIDIRFPGYELNSKYDLYTKYRWEDQDFQNEYILNINENEQYQDHLKVFNNQLQTKVGSFNQSFVLTVKTDEKIGRLFKNEKFMMLFPYKTNFDQEDFQNESDFVPRDKYYQETQDYNVLTKSMKGEANTEQFRERSNINLIITMLESQKYSSQVYVDYTQRYIYNTSYDMKWYLLYVSGFLFTCTLILDFMFIKSNLVSPIQQMRDLMENPEKQKGLINKQNDIESGRASKKIIKLRRKKYASFEKFRFKNHRAYQKVIKESEDYEQTVVHESEVNEVAQLRYLFMQYFFHSKKSESDQKEKIMMHVEDYGMNALHYLIHYNVESLPRQHEQLFDNEKVLQIQKQLIEDEEFQELAQRLYSIAKKYLNLRHSKGRKSQKGNIYNYKKFTEQNKQTWVEEFKRSEDKDAFITWLGNKIQDSEFNWESDSVALAKARNTFQLKAAQNRQSIISQRSIVNQNNLSFDNFESMGLSNSRHLLKKSMKKLRRTIGDSSTLRKVQSQRNIQRITLLEEEIQLQAIHEDGAEEDVCSSDGLENNKWSRKKQAQTIVNKKINTAARPIEIIRRAKMMTPAKNQMIGVQYNKAKQLNKPNLASGYKTIPKNTQRLQHSQSTAIFQTSKPIMFFKKGRQSPYLSDFDNSSLSSESDTEQFVRPNLSNFRNLHTGTSQSEDHMSDID